MRARFVDGVLTPLEPLDLQDGCEVVLSVDGVVETEPTDPTLAALLKPFDLDAFLNNPAPKIFNPDELVPIDVTDDEWEAFDRAIREGREV
ncbi:MAG: antitoxin family protein [Chloroflexota bacterium]|nr:antitoxin family protein [Chloroflexota bacterium]